MDDDTEVLVVGGGAAGLKAAIESSRSGLQVLLLSKGKSCFSNAHCEYVAINAPSNSVEKETYLRDVHKVGGRCPNMELVERIVNDAYPSLKELESQGINFVKGNNYQYKSYDDPMSLSDKLRIYARDNGVEFSENTICAGLLTEKSRVAGAIVTKKDEVFTIRAKSIIIATGGCGNAYKYTTNPKGITGDGVVIAHEKGVPLVGLEMIKFFPCSINPKFALPYALLKSGHLKTGRNRTLTAYNNDNATYSEIYQNRKDGVFLDCSEVDSSNFPTTFNFFRENGVALENNEIPIIIAAHYMLGGIKVHNDCSTVIKGLYAAGEVVGGVHGTNRLVGDGILLALCLGKIAGKNASLYAKRVNKCKVSQNKIVDDIIRERKGVDVEELVWKCKNIMYQNVALIRNKKNLEKTFILLNRLKKELSDANSKSLPEYIDSRNLIIISELITHSAILRNESRLDHKHDPIKISKTYAKLDMRENTGTWKSGVS